MPKFPSKRPPVEDYAVDTRLLGVSKKVRAVRILKELSQHALGRECEVHHSQIALFERGVSRALSVRYLLNVLDALGLELAVRVKPLRRTETHELFVGYTSKGTTNFAAMLA